MLKNIIKVALLTSGLLAGAAQAFQLNLTVGQDLANNGDQLDAGYAIYTGSGGNYHEDNLNLLGVNLSNVEKLLTQLNDYSFKGVQPGASLSGKPSVMTFGYRDKNGDDHFSGNSKFPPPPSCQDISIQNRPNNTLTVVVTEAGCTVS